MPYNVEALQRIYRTRSTAKLRRILRIKGQSNLQRLARQHAYNEIVRRRGERAQAVAHRGWKPTECAA